jgi:hypothetical protein
MTQRFRITIECDAELRAAQIWPDGDGPAQPKASHVLERIRETVGRNAGNLIVDWNLAGDSVVNVEEV